MRALLESPAFPDLEVDGASAPLGAFWTYVQHTEPLSEADGLGRSDPFDIARDDEEVAGYHRPGLTTARLPYDEMGRLGIEMLLGGVKDHVLLPMPLIRRASVRTLGDEPLPAALPQ